MRYLPSTVRLKIHRFSVREVSFLTAFRQTMDSSQKENLTPAPRGCGFTDHLVKPVNLSTLEKLLEGKRPGVFGLEFLAIVPT